jgi:hypothetical protein
MAQKIEVVIQNLYKEIPEVPLVVEATMEEHVSIIGEVIKYFHRKIENLQLCTVRGTLPEEREGTKRTTMTTIENIKKLEGECTKLCEESAQI